MKCWSKVCSSGCAHLRSRTCWMWPLMGTPWPLSARTHCGRQRPKKYRIERMSLLKLTQPKVAGVRAALLVKQGGLCALCQLPLPLAQAVLDHDHATGLVRGTIHRSCNSLLGTVENNCKRFGVQHLSAFLHGAASYLQSHAVDRTGLVHPSHKTEDEKRDSRNKKARLSRAKKKAAE